MIRRIKLGAWMLVLLVLLMAAEVWVIRKAADTEPTLPVVVAARKIPRGTILTDGMLTVRQVRLGSSPAGAVSRTEPLIGAPVLETMYAGEPVRTERVGAAGSLPPPAAESAENRLVTLALSAEQANGWWLKAGQKVDVIFVSTAKTEPDAPAPLNLKGIRVAGILDERGQPLKEVRDLPPRAVALEVTQGQAAYIAWARYHGKIELAAVPEEEKAP